MDFISDAEMAKLNAPDFIKDSEVSAPDFIPDNPSYLGEMVTGSKQGLQNAGASLAKLGSGAAAFLTDSAAKLPGFNKKIDKFFGVDNHEELQTIPGKVTQTVTNILPYTINKPAAFAGVGTMYNDLVDQLVSQGVPKNEARRLALKENAAMLGTAAVVGVGGAKALGALVKPTSQLAQRGINAAAGGMGFELGTEAQTAVHNAGLTNRPDLQRTLTNEERIVSALSGGALGGMHRPQKTKEAPKESPFGLAPEFVPENSKMAKAEYDLLASTRKVLEDKAEKINLEAAAIEREVGRTGEAKAEHIEALTFLEDSLKKVVEDLVEHDRVMSGDITAEVNTGKALAADIRRNELIEMLKSRREQTETPFVETKNNVDTPQKVDPTEMALTKISEAMAEPKEKLSDRIFEAYEKLDKIEDKPENSSIREALKREIDAYEAIERGEKPDLSWAQPEAVKPTFRNRVQPTSIEVADLVRTATTMGEVFTRIREAKVGSTSQRVLLDLLSRNQRLLSAGFRLGQAIEKDGKFSLGSYNNKSHVVELHNNGTLRTIIHEGIHAATHAMLADNTSKPAMALNRLFEQYKAEHGERINEAGNKYYGFTDVHEFVTEAYTNQGFQRLLLRIPSGEVSPTGRVLKMWDKFKNIVKDAFYMRDKERTAFDEVMDHGSQLIELSGKKSEGFWKKLSDKQSAQVAPSMPEIPSTKEVRDFIVRKTFGMNALEGMFRDHPRVKAVFKDIRSSIEAADKIQNELWHGTSEVLAKGKVGFMDTLTKVKDKGSAIIAVTTTANKDMAIIHDLFKRGFEEGIDYKDNLVKNGEHLTPGQIKVYDTLSKLFAGMYESTITVQRELGKKHELPYRAGWYPAKRNGQFSVEISFNGNNVYVESFPTRMAAENFRKKVTDGKNLKHLEVSDILDKNDKNAAQPNKEMADIIGSHLAQKYPTAGPELKKSIDKLMHSMQTRGGKLGYHHQHRTNVRGYKGSELFADQEKLGSSFKEGIQNEVNNFGMNLRTLMIKHKVEPKLSDEAFRMQDPTGHKVAQQIFDSALGRNEDFLSTKTGGDRVSHAIDKVVAHVMERALGKQFEGGAYSKSMDVAMRAFYATKMMAKPLFALAQVLQTPMIIPEMAREQHGLRAFYSFGKGMTKVMTGNKELMDHIKEISQEYNVTEAQYLESMNLSKHTGTEGKVAKVLNTIEETVLMGKVGKGADSMSRMLSYAAAYTHYTDLGLPKAEASARARLATDKAMNTYDSASSAAMFENLGIIGQGMKPLTSFGLNQLGNFISYAKSAKGGDVAPLVSYALVATAMGGVLSLPFIQEYERFRQIAEKMFDMTIPSILEIFSGDESFLDRLNITSQDAKDVALYGLPALSGIDMTSSMRSNETLVSIMAAVALGQEDAKKLFPVLGATVDTVMAIPKAVGALGGMGSVAEGRTAIDSIISGPIGYGLKEMRGLNTTKSLGKSTNMINTGKTGDADIERTPTDIMAGFLGGRSVRQRSGDTQAFEMAARDKIRQQKQQDLMNMLSETGDKKYIKRLIDTGMTADQVMSGIEAGVYKKNVDQYIRYFVSSKGTVDEKKAERTINFGIRK